jgi:hypothetical protein
MPKAVRIMPEQTYLRECFRYNRKTGVLIYRTRPRHHFSSDLVYRRWNSRFAGKIAGCADGRGYLHICINGIQYYAHRLIWKLVSGSEPIEEVDHKDRDPTNYRWRNLREATRQQGLFNSNARKTGHSKGTYRMTKGKWSRWIAQIQHNGRTVYLGHFETEQEAHEAYCAAARKHFGRFWASGHHD